MSELVAYPNGVDESLNEYKSVDSSHPFSTVFGKSHENTTFARWYMVTGSAASTMVFFTFDLSAIPQNAVIDSLSVTAKSRVENDSIMYAGYSTLALCENTEVIDRTEGTAAFSETEKAVTVTSTNFTREMLNNFRVKLHNSRGVLGTKNDYYVDFFGCTLEIQYTVANTEKFMLKTNGVWKECTEIYKKVNGAWVLQNDMNSIFEVGINYK